MYSIALITETIKKKNIPSSTGNILKTNLNEILEDKITVNNYYLDNLDKINEIKEDIILVMTREKIDKIKPYVKNKNKIIITERTFLSNNIYKLFEIKENESVLVVNDCYDTTLETINALYQTGIKHIKLIPIENNKDYKNIKIAITPGEKEHVPKYIENIIDLGSRVMDISTIFRILSILKIDDYNIQNNIIKYLEKIVSKNTGIKENYKNLIIKMKELDLLLDLSKEGILLTDISGNIIECNESFKKIFSISTKIKNKNIKNILKDFDFKNYLNSNEIKNEIIIYKNKYLNLNKKDLIYFDNQNRLFFSIDDITHIKHLEQNLSKKLRKKGQIAKYTFDSIITKSDIMKKTIDIAKKISKNNMTILIRGESGTGKEVLAQAIHNNSTRSSQPFVALNCAAMPENLLESELFGYTKGSFTGALKQGKQGLFEQANNGTIFLDEIGDMPLHLQTKLLRVLQERQVMPIGSNEVIDIDVRIIAATHRNLLSMVETQKFRNDLYYRLNVLPLNLPPLKDRFDDIILLFNEFSNFKYELDDKVISYLLNYNWPGNIRELMNLTSYINALCENNKVDLSILPKHIIKNTEVNSKLNDEIKSTSDDDFKQIFNILNLKGIENESMNILNIILQLQNLNISSGRKNISLYLNQNELNLSDSKIRKVLEILKNLNLLESKRGRAGHKLTNQGFHFLNYLKNKKK
ncbi:MAG: sigma 54-interacting transcriptional regulator [Peptostreptococcaceae bacterium]|jgi:transcriptional regulator with PAS, ATPase and Fis domain|nr:sigma 54-interacting transcriptional regulator [Peptostreptococcaceae bacterium]